MIQIDKNIIHVSDEIDDLFYLDIFPDEFLQSSSFQEEGTIYIGGKISICNIMIKTNKGCFRLNFFENKNKAIDYRIEPVVKEPH